MISACKKLSMSSWVLLSFAFGIIAGLFFGEMLAWMQVIGDAFIKLLQMTIIPFITVSLISSLGKLSIEKAKLLGKHVGKLMLIIWGFGLLAMFSVQAIFPSWEAGDFFSLSALTAPESVNLLDLYIPSNPFYSLSNSYIPAIVLFCVATGVALISIEKKEVILEPLQLLSDAFNKITGYIVKLMPIGIFAMTAATAGTMDLAELEKLQVYFIAHILMTLLLTYWLLPAILASFTPFSYKDITTIANDAMITAFASGNIFIILPLLIERTKDLFKKYDMAGEHTDDYANIIIPVVFSFPNLGKLLAIVFVLFAAWFSGSHISFWQYIPMAVNGLISLFGSIYLTIPMLLDSLELSSDLFQLFMVSSLFTSRFTSLLAAMNIFILAVGGTAMLAGLAQLKLKRLFLYAALTPVVFAVALLSIAWLLSNIVDTDYVMDDVVTHMSTAQKLPENVVSYHIDENAAPVPRRTVNAIKKSGVLKVGYNPRQVPFSFFNANNKLVGFDIDMMERLAAELKVELAFVPHDMKNAGIAMKRGHYDIAISGQQMTTHRLQELLFTTPVLDLHYSLVVKDHHVDDFTQEKFQDSNNQMRFAAVGDYSILPQLTKRFPNIIVDNISADSVFFEDDGKTWDALIISLEAGKAWSILYPSYTTLFDRDQIKSYPAAYAVAKGNTDLQNFLNGWLTIQHSSGYIDELYDYWILGKNAVPKTSRWSVIKDVLHWVDE